MSGVETPADVHAARSTGGSRETGRRSEVRFAVNGGLLAPGRESDVPAGGQLALERAESEEIEAPRGWERLRIRTGVLLGIAFARCAGEACLCALLAAGNGLDAAVAQLLLLLVALEDGQGFISFLLFGLQPEFLRVVARLLVVVALARDVEALKAAARHKASVERSAPRVPDFGRAARLLEREGARAAS